MCSGTGGRCVAFRHSFVRYCNGSLVRGPAMLCRCRARGGVAHCASFVQVPCSRRALARSQHCRSLGRCPDPLISQAHPP